MMGLNHGLRLRLFPALASIRPPPMRSAEFLYGACTGGTDDVLLAS